MNELNEKLKKKEADYQILLQERDDKYNSLLKQKEDLENELEKFKNILIQKLKLNNNENIVEQIETLLNDKDTIITQQATNIAARNTQIEQLKTQITELEAKEKSEKEKINDQLQIIVSMILIDPDFFKAIAKIINTVYEPIKEVSILIKFKTCNLLNYLNKILFSQIDKLNETFKSDIFNIYETNPIYNSNDLLVELVNLFQELFLSLNQSEILPTEINLKSNYPQLINILDSSPILKNNNIFNIDNYGYLSLMELNKINNTLIIRKKINSPTALTIFAIKLIQLWKNKIKETLDLIDCDFIKVKKDYTQFTASKYLEFIDRDLKTDTTNPQEIEKLINKIKNDVVGLKITAGKLGQFNNHMLYEKNGSFLYEKINKKLKQLGEKSDFILKDENKLFLNPKSDWSRLSSFIETLDKRERINPINLIK